jgi:osmotically-inducible protein OsmY
MNADRQNHTMSLLVGAGIGAALMYFLDPDRGARRRHLVGDQALGMLRKARRDADKAMRDARNRAQGVIAETRAGLTDDDASDDRIVARVRAELGRHVERASDIDIVVEDGTVRLHGNLPPADATRVVAAIEGVRGVQHVDSRLSETADWEMP